MAAAVLVVAIAAFAAFRGRVLPSAEAATLEGVVVDNSNGVLSLQTEDGIEDVSLDAKASVTDASGASLDAEQIGMGQVVQLHRGKKVAQGGLAKLVRLPAAGALQTWCSDHVLHCRSCRPTSSSRLDVYRTTPARPCRIVRQRLQSLTTQLHRRGALEDLKGRCQQGGILACRELAAFCSQRAEVCKSIANFLRQHAPPAPDDGDWFTKYPASVVPPRASTPISSLKQARRPDTVQRIQDEMDQAWISSRWRRGGGGSGDLSLAGGHGPASAQTPSGTPSPYK